MAYIQRKIALRARYALGKATRYMGKMHRSGKIGKVQVILSRLWRRLSRLTKKMTKKLAGNLRRSLCDSF